MKDLFPSPIGELHFSIDPETYHSFHNPFPSPIGELHFSINADDTAVYAV